MLTRELGTIIRCLPRVASNLNRFPHTIAKKQEYRQKMFNFYLGCTAYNQSQTEYLDHCNRHQCSMSTLKQFHFLKVRYSRTILLSSFAGDERSMTASLSYLTWWSFRTNVLLLIMLVKNVEFKASHLLGFLLTLCCKHDGASMTVFATWFTLPTKLIMLLNFLFAQCFVTSLTKSIYPYYLFDKMRKIFKIRVFLLYNCWSHTKRP